MPDETEDLYGLPLEAFTAARNELATRLRKEGRRQEAEAVRKLPKPSLTAWALNQVARQEPELVGRLLQAAAGLRTAQQALLAGQGSAAFRTATDQQRAAVEALTTAAARALEDSGHAVNKAATDRLEATLRAAAADPEQGVLLRAGRLTEDLNPAGFGFGFGDLEDALGASLLPFRGREPAGHASTRSTEAKEEDRLAAARQLIASLRQETEHLRLQAAEAERDQKQAREAAAQAERAADAARLALSRAEAEAKRQAGLVEEADARRAALHQRLDATSRELEMAQAELGDLKPVGRDTA